MSESKHTSGPWYVVDDGEEVFILDAAHKAPQGIASTRLKNGLSKSENEANAKLMAASPEMIAVLIELQAAAAYWSEYDVPVGIVERISAVIAKAKGIAS